MDAKTSDVPSYQNPIRKKIYDFFIERNILLRPLGNTIYILPPYIITEIELAGIYAAIREFENTLKQ
jgi:adenosylmethionine-8-amino-7-oxononanoate aminotransferase